VSTQRRGIDWRLGSSRQDASRAKWRVHCTACDASKLSPIPDYWWHCGSPLEAGWLLAEVEGIFVEPAAATSVAGASVTRQLGHIDESASVVCLLTGHGLRCQAPRAEPGPESAADGAELVRAIRRDVGDYG
jgi:hypothetical protein